MKNLFLITALALPLIACDRHDKPLNPPATEQNYDHAEQEYDEDNTGKNVRDRNSMTKTPLDQSESESDRMITKKIRQKIMSDDSLSTNAKNIKIITIKGVVTLRGPVADSEEKEAIAQKVSEIQGVLNVDDQLEISRK